MGAAAYSIVFPVLGKSFSMFLIVKRDYCVSCIDMHDISKTVDMFDHEMSQRYLRGLKSRTTLKTTF